MAVRNFWIEVDVDGRKTNVGTGPRSKDGGFTVRIYQRDDGGITQPGYITGLVDSLGNLILRCNINGKVSEYVTKR